MRSAMASSPRPRFNLKIDGAECRAEFEAIVAGLAQEFQPRTMSDHLMVQQLAGCYWRLAKVWRYEQEAAWRMWKAPGMPIEEYNEFHDDEEFVGFPIRDRLVEEACKFLPSAGLDSPTIPNGAVGAHHAALSKCGQLDAVSHPGDSWSVGARSGWPRENHSRRWIT